MRELNIKKQSNINPVSPIKGVRDLTTTEADSLSKETGLGGDYVTDNFGKKADAIEPDKLVINKYNKFFEQGPMQNGELTFKPRAGFERAYSADDVRTKILKQIQLENPDKKIRYYDGGALDVNPLNPVI